MKKENIKEFKPETSKNIGKDFSSKKFELYEITMESEKLKAFRKAYIDTFKGNLVNRIISSSPVWFNYTEGLFDADKVLKGNYFEFGYLPIKRINKDFIIGFIENPTLSSQVRAIKFEGKTYFIYLNSNIVKNGRTYQVSPTLKINEDLYNIAKIQARDFSGLTVSDLSRYREFFKVGNIPYLTITENWIEDLYRNGHITREEYNNRLKKYENEVRLVQTLR